MLMTPPAGFLRFRAPEPRLQRPLRQIKHLSLWIVNDIPNCMVLQGHVAERRGLLVSHQQELKVKS